MLATIEAKLIAAAAVLLLMLGAYATAHHLGAVSQKAVDQVQIDKLTAAHASDKGLLAAEALTMNDINAQAAVNKKVADAAQAKAATAVAAADKSKAALATASANWSARLAAAEKTPDCAKVLELKLCPAVSGY